MLIFFGTRAKTSVGQPITSVCPKCGTNRFSTFGIRRYFHIFLVPFFPTALIPGIECLHCKYTRLGKEIEPILASRIKASVFTKKQILPLFFGSFVMLLLFLSLTIGIMNQQSAIDRYFANPRVNDYYIVNILTIVKDANRDHPYGILKVMNIKPNGITFLAASHVYKYSTDATHAVVVGEDNNKGFFGAEPIFIEKESIEKMKSSGSVMNIKRF